MRHVLLHCSALAILVLANSSCARMPNQHQHAKSATDGGAELLYPLEGSVIRLDAERKVATIKHGTLKDARSGKVWMEAMTMDFPVRDAAEFAKLKEGMQVRAMVHHREADMEYWLTDIKPAQ